MAQIVIRFLDQAVCRRNHSYKLAEKSEAHDIRLFVLLPGKEGDVVRGHVYIAKASEKREYEALSYTWGNANKTAEISIQDMTVNVTQSLALALRNLRSPDTPRTLWIDSICINQNDIAEKNSQIQLMPFIYERAKNVVIWLGEATQDSPIGLQILKYLASSQQPSARPPWKSLPPELAQRGLQDILDREWFRRIWVVQEAALSQIATITCGPHTFSWNSNDCTAVRRFMRMIKFAELSPAWKQAGLEQINFGPLMELLDLQIGLQLDREHGTTHRQASDILDIAYEMRHRSSTDPRDKIFALAGIGCNMMTGGDNLRLDYEMSVEQAYEHLGSVIKV